MNTLKRSASCYQRRPDQLTDLDVTTNTDLAILYCGDNELLTLDISNNTHLGDVPGDWNWSSFHLDLSNMPNLGKVCVWTKPFPTDGIEVNTEGSPNVYFSELCE
jgi:hypothetical protein